MSSLRYTLQEKGLQLCCEAREGLGGYYATAAPYLDGEHYGAPNYSFGELSSGAHRGHWGVDADIARELDAMVTTISKERMHRAREYNGPTVILIQSHRAGDQLQLNLAPSNYVSVLAAQALGYGDSFRALGVHISLITTDGQLCLSRRSGEVAFMPGQIDTSSSGMVEPPVSVLAPDIDLHKEALCETLAEVSADLALTASEIIPRSFGIVTQDDQTSAALFLEADIPCSFDELMALHASAPGSEAWEVADFIALPLPDPASIQWLEDHLSELTPLGLCGAFLALARVHGERAIERAWREVKTAKID